jgi:hypothetical protein
MYMWRHLPMMIQYKKTVKLFQELVKLNLIKAEIDVWNKLINLYLDDTLIHSTSLYKRFNHKPNFIFPDEYDQVDIPEYLFYRTCDYFLDTYFGVPYEFIPKNPTYKVKIIIVVCNEYVFKVPIDIKPDLYNDRYIDDL